MIFIFNEILHKSELCLLARFSIYSDFLLGLIHFNWQVGLVGWYHQDSGGDEV